MAILRKRQRGQFTVIDNTIFRDTELSNKALGMLCRMLSMPDGWSFSVNGLVTLSSDGKSAVMSQLDELEYRGYLIRNQVREDGKIAGVEYIVSETKLVDFPYADNQHAEKQNAEIQYAENPTLSNTYISNTKESITDLSNTKGIYIAEFEKLWAMYPNKKGKDTALKKYIKARKGGTTYEEVEKGILAYKDYIETRHIGEQYIKHGSSFFSQAAWNDDYSIPGQREKTAEEIALDEEFLKAFRGGSQ